MASLLQIGWLLAACILNLLNAEKCCVGQAPETQNLTVTAIRLVSGKYSVTTSGRVELQGSNGVWGTICPQYWSSVDDVDNVFAICSMLGFRNGGVRVRNTFGDGNKNFLIENVTCPINASSLYQCVQKFVKTCGPSNEELAVTCNNDPNGANYVNLTEIYFQTSIYVPNARRLQEQITYGNCSSKSNLTRILGGDDPTTQGIGNGYVQLFVNNSWSFISNDNWDEADAKVVCRELCYESNAGFTPIPAAITKSVPDQINPNIQVAGFNCQGSENRLQDCSSLGTRSASTLGVIAGVQCTCDNPVVNITLPEVNCSGGSLQTFFAVSIFHFQITASDILHYNKFPSGCINVTSDINGTLVVIALSPNCGTLMQENTTHIIYTNKIRLLLTSGLVVITKYIDYRYNLVCVIPKKYVVSNRWEGYFVEKNATLYDQYNFSLSLDLYTNCNFTGYYATVGSIYLVEIGQWIDAAVTINNYDNKTKLVITDCDAYPVLPYYSYTPVANLIKNKCPVDDSLTIYTLDNRREGMQFRAFTFAGYSMVYISCSVNICLLDSNSTECDRTCSSSTSGRKKREATPLKTFAVQSRQMLLMEFSARDIKAFLAQDQNRAAQEETTNSGIPDVKNPVTASKQGDESTNVPSQLEPGNTSTGQPQTTDSTKIPKQQEQENITVPLQPKPYNISVPRQQKPEITNAPLDQESDSTGDPRQQSQKVDNTNSPRQQEQENTTVPLQPKPYNISVPRQQKPEITNAPLDQESDSTGDPRQQSQNVDSTNIPRQQEQESTTVPLQPKPYNISVPRQQKPEITIASLDQESDTTGVPRLQTQETNSINIPRQQGLDNTISLRQQEQESTTDPVQPKPYNTSVHRQQKPEITNAPLDQESDTTGAPRQQTHETDSTDIPRQQEQENTTIPLQPKPYNTSVPRQQNPEITNAPLDQESDITGAPRQQAQESIRSTKEVYQQQPGQLLHQVQEDDSDKESFSKEQQTISGSSILDGDSSGSRASTICLFNIHIVELIVLFLAVAQMLN